MNAELKEKVNEIKTLGLDKLKEYFELTMENLETIDNEVKKHKYNQARLGVQFYREAGVEQRAVERNFIAIGKLVSDSREAIKEYLQKKLPEYM